MISGNITLCGKPKPNVTWFIGDKIIDDVRTERTTTQHEYRYSFQLNTTSDMCGRKVSYRASRLNNQVEGAAVISIKECK